MFSQEDIAAVLGRPVYSHDQTKLGTVGRVLLDGATGQPEFMTVDSGLLGKRHSLVPVREAAVTSDRVVVPYAKDKVRHAPALNTDAGQLDASEMASVRAYYGGPSDTQLAT